MDTKQVARRLVDLCREGKYQEAHATRYSPGDEFAVMVNFDITPKTGPGACKRTMMEEVAVYTVKNGKIVHEEFMD